jgi:mRNA interferase MazF
VVSADDFNRSRIQTATVAIVTSSTQLARARGNVFIPRGTAGLDRDSVINVSQLTTVDKDDLERRLGALPPQLADDVAAGLRLALDL